MKSLPAQDPIEFIYNTYVKDKSKRHKKEGYDGWFSASSAGSCYRRQWYNIHEEEQGVLPERVLRLLRLGTLLHKDIEDSIEYAKLNFPVDFKTGNILTEHEVELTNLKVLGHLDIAVIEDDHVDVYDVKTIASYKFQMKFGKKPERNPWTNYEMQLATYALGLMNDPVTKVPATYSLKLMYYKKDNSDIRVQNLDAEMWMDAAMEYWIDLSETLSEIDDPKDLIPGTSMGVPIQPNECKYCSYKELCPGVFSV